jgi:hypothetical protein
VAIVALLHRRFPTPKSDETPWGLGVCHRFIGRTASFV